MASLPVKKLNTGTTESILVEANDLRSVLAIANADGSNIVFISDEQGKGTDGFPIFTKSYIAIDRGEGFEPEKKYWVISEDANTPVHVMEQFQKFKEPPKAGEDIQDIPPKDPRM